jgi:hypothetical protein
VTVKALSHGPQSPERQRSQAMIDERVRQLFRRLPLLLGFSLEPDLSIADIEMQVCPGCDWDDDVYRDVDAELSALLADLEHDGAVELLRGRTFARTVH